MKARVLIAAGLFFAFAMGAVTAMWYSGPTETFNAGRQTVRTSIRDSAAVTTRVPESRSGYVSRSKDVRVTDVRSSEFIPIEAAVAADEEDEEGAAVGAVSGVVAGLLYDLVTRKKAGF